MQKAGAFLAVAMLGFWSLGDWWESRVADLAPAAEGVVEEFFDSLLDGDTEGALTHTDLTPADVAPALLRPELIGEDWTVTKIEAGVPGDPAIFASRRVSTTSEVEVSVTIEFDDTAATGTLVVARAHDGAVFIPDPFNHIQLDPLRTQREAQVNGQSVEPVRDMFLPLLPGVYDFGTGSNRIAVFPDTHLTGDETSPVLDPSEEHLEAMQATLDARADRCAEATALAAPECNVDLEEEEDVPPLSSATDIEWSVTAYAQFTLTPESPSELVGYPETDGTFEITGSAVYSDSPDAPEHRHPFRVSCTYTVLNIRPTIAVDGSVDFLEDHPPFFGSSCELID